MRPLQIAAASLLLAMPARAQQPARPPDFVSPEVHADRRVSFRLWAPSADSVRLTGEILDGAQPRALRRDSAGTWRVTVGPMVPDIYTYGFDVDGVRLPDPRNGWVKTGPGEPFATVSQVEVPGDSALYYDAKPVPHGLVSMLTYESRSLGATRRALVYTPPGYERGRERYPLVVLMHGSGETELDWAMTGRANYIADNLLAAGRMQPMVIVMPLGHARASLGTGPLPARDTTSARRGFAYAAIERDLLQELLPEVERRFRVATSPDRRAIMGLSLGGSQATRIGLNNLDTFRWIVPLAAAYVEPDPATGFERVLADVAGTNRRLKLLRILIGKDDFLLPGNRKFAALLADRGVRHEFVIEEGRHEWRVWRRQLHDVLPLLFQAR